MKTFKKYIASDMRIDYPYSLLEIIKMQDNGLSLLTMSFDEQKEAKRLEKAGLIKKVLKRDNRGVYTVYEII